MTYTEKHIIEVYPGIAGVLKLEGNTEFIESLSKNHHLFNKSRIAKTALKAFNREHQTISTRI